MSKNVTHYHYKDCCLYNVKSKSKLFKLLYISKNKYKEFQTNSESLYKNFPKAKSDGSLRNISAPRPDLKNVQRRIHQLLSKIQPPNFLISPVKGKSYIDNAAAHKNFNQLRKLDILNYYPNCTGNRVIWFFHKYMKCSIDVAVILKNLVTLGDRLPQGSPSSPILAYLCYCDMWNEINQIICSKSCTLTLYVDDLTISGKFISGEMIWEIKKIINRFGHKTNIQKERSVIGKSTEVTGVIINENKLLLPNRQHKTLHELTNLDLKDLNEEHFMSLQKQIQGRLVQANQISKNSL